MQEQAPRIAMSYLWSTYAQTRPEAEKRTTKPNKYEMQSFSQSDEWLKSTDVGSVKEGRGDRETEGGSQEKYKFISWVENE